VQPDGEIAPEALCTSYNAGRKGKIKFREELQAEGLDDEVEAVPLSMANCSASSVDPRSVCYLGKPPPRRCRHRRESRL